MEDSTPAGGRLLDVGAGPGGGEIPYLSLLRPHVNEVIGVDPDPRVANNELLDDHMCLTLEDYAAKCPATADVATAVYVVEHLVDPVPFVVALRDVLRPGGVAFLVTPHLWHYFGAVALLANRSGIDEWLLHKLRSEEVLHAHHHAIAYRLNTRAAITRAARRVGFRSIEFRMVEDPGVFEPYFPRPLRVLPSMWSAMVHRFQLPALAGTLLARLER
jgi:SAM-dependent methyltransferase